MKLFLAIFGLIGMSGLGYLMMHRNAPPELTFAEVKVETLVDTLATNGKVEPVEWAAVRAERAGKLTRLFVERGKAVRAGATIATQDAAEFQPLIDSAEARAKQAQAEREALDNNGRPAELAQVDGAVRKAKLELENARKELTSLQRLEAKNAVSRYEVTKAAEAVAAFENEIKSLEVRRTSFGSLPSEKKAAEARLAEARAAINQVRQKSSQGVLTSPINGVVYQLDPKQGAFLNPGDLVANIGRLDKLRVSVYVDEPELGRVSIGMPVTITWDAVTGKQWKGAVDRLPLQIVPLQSRQVGEVLVGIDNPDADLVPGSNVNAFIRSRVAENALTVPKECIRKEGEVSGVYVFEGTIIKWRPVKVGVSNITRAQIVDGVKAKDRVVIASEKALKDGMAAVAVNPN